MISGKAEEKDKWEKGDQGARRIEGGGGSREGDIKRVLISGEVEEESREGDSKRVLISGEADEEEEGGGGGR